MRKLIPNCRNAMPHVAHVLGLGLLVFTSGRLPGTLGAQTLLQESEQFEVASIRPSAANGRPSMEFTPGGFRAANVTLKMLIEVAYDIRSEQVSGGAGWTDSEQYTAVAKAPQDGPRLEEADRKTLTRKRLQALLNDRFHLVLKLAANPDSGYVLTLEKGGPKMTVPDEAATRMMRQVGRWEIRAEATGMSTLARFLSVHLRATVLDGTGLEGRYNFHLNWTPSPLPTSLQSLNGLPEDSLIPAVREQLGLRLVRQKVETDRYTIEHAEKPSAN